MISRIIALLLLIILSPFILLVAVIILIEDGAPVFFKQKRVGQNNSFFWMYKFRSMKNDTPNVATHLLYEPDKYLLRIGKVIRKISFDEIPNLINIAKGEMLFVGPRPALYNQEDLLQMRKSNGIDILKPGLTGWAQVNGRDENSLDEKINLENFYLANQSIYLDMKIIFLTFYNVLFSKGIKH
jgi:O-antigen biosynthesis protein WbqP